MTVQTDVRVDGDGDLLILVHGVGLDHTMWDPVVPHLAERRAVVRYDLLGHGATADAEGERSLDDFAGQLLAVIDALGVGRADVVGLSLGALIVGALASRHPERVGSVVLSNCVFERDPEGVAAARGRLQGVLDGGMESMVGPAIERWFSELWRNEHPEHVDAIREVLLANDVGAYVKAYRVFIDGDQRMPEAATDISAPTLAVTGEFDVGSTPAMTEALARAIPNARARILAGLRHLPPIEAPRSYTAVLLDFLDQE